MAHTVDNLMLLCRCLRRGSGSAADPQLKAELGRSQDDYKGLVALASEHLLTPALYIALKHKNLSDCLPEELRSYLAEVHALNLERNKELKAQALDIAAALNEIDIEPILLKGGVHLFQPALGDLGSRMMIDLDMLIPPEAMDPCLHKLGSMGFSGSKREWSYQFPAIAREDDRATLELHIEIAEQRSVLPLEEGLRDAIDLDTGTPTRMRALSPTNQVWHTIFHAQVQDRAYFLGKLDLRSLHEMVAHDERFGLAIDWTSVAERMRAHGLARQFTAHVYQANTLFDAGIPTDGDASLGTRLHFGRCRLQIRVRPLHRVVSAFGALSHPFRRYHIELLYGRSDRPISLLIKRLRHACRLVIKYNWRGLRKVCMIARYKYPTSG